jgi:Glucose / Sorbosone dehydrogenase
MGKLALVVAGVMFVCATPAKAAPGLVQIGSFSSPTYATSPPGDPSRVFVTERPGRVQLMVDGVAQPMPFLDLGSITQSSYVEQGLLSIAFARDYATSGRFYVYLTVTAAASVSGTEGEIQVREYRRSAANPNVADPASERLILAIRHSDAQNHNGGQLQFGPDGQLWLGTGDGGGGDNQFGHADDPNSLLGKLIEIDPAQASPAPKILAMGLRNPWRFSFDRATGQLVIGDVGQAQYEEVDVGLGANYGWPCKEGLVPYKSDPGCATATLTDPVLVRPHSVDNVCAIVGGYVVRDPGLPTLAGRYIYGDNCDPDLRSTDLTNAPATDAATGLQVPGLSSFGEDACGHILVVSLNGPVSRLVDGSPSPCTAAPTPAPAVAAQGCKLSARVSGLRSVRRRHRLTVTLATDKACTATVGAAIAHVAHFRAARHSLSAGKRTAFRLRLTSRGRRAVSRALRRHRSLRVTLTIRAVDGAGKLTSLRRAAHIRG